MKDLVLFSEQEELVAKVGAEWKTGKRFPLLQSSTGSGKTAMGAKIIQRARAKNFKCAFVVPRKTLFKQTRETFIKYGIQHGYIASGRDYNPFANVYLCMAETLASRIEDKKVPENIGLVEVDETHFGDGAIDTIIKHFRNNTWIENGKKRRAFGLGLSATPWKMNGQGLGVWYDVMIEGKSIRELIDMGRLSDYSYYYGRPDFQQGGKIKFKSDAEAAEYMESQSVIIGDAVRDYELRCLGKTHLARCTSIKHSQMTAEAFRAKGHTAVHVDGKTKDLVPILKAYARREIGILTFADLLNFGFDVAQITGIDVTVESGSDMKNSDSLAGQLQWWGRMLRYKPYKAVINDHVNNYLKHGLPCSPRSWTLDSLASRPLGEKAPPTKQCPKCFFVHPPAPMCPECKTVYEVDSRETLTIEGQLEEMDIAAFHARQKPKVDGLDEILPPLDDEESLNYLIKYAQKMGYKNPTSWAAKELAKRMNVTYNKLSNNGG